ncbi:MAG TPA: helix-turn-helix domain-containing protein [Longimicrobiales bacterium]|nr:helix-turn-helix domain-containing protein [Longimicrobiales bacterium]
MSTPARDADLSAPGRQRLFRWRELVCGPAGPEKATTRHVLLTLATHMDVNGGSCYPSTRRLATETALTQRSVITHLEEAEREGWIRIDKRYVRARASYIATFPPAERGSADSAERGSAETAPNPTHPKAAPAEPDDTSAERGSPRLLNEVQRSTSVSSSESTSTPTGGASSAAPPRRSGSVDERQQLVTHLSTAILNAGGPAIGRSAWGSQVKIAGAALEDIPLGELRDAITWAAGDDHWRPRLAAQRAKVLRDVHAAWLDRDRTRRPGGRSTGDMDELPQSTEPRTGRMTATNGRDMGEEREKERQRQIAEWEGLNQGESHRIRAEIELDVRERFDGTPEGVIDRIVSSRVRSHVGEILDGESGEAGSGGGHEPQLAGGSVML